MQGYGYYIIFSKILGIFLLQNEIDLDQNKLPQVLNAK
jgi:hypothetical protein